MGNNIFKKFYLYISILSYRFFLIFNNKNIYLYFKENYLTENNFLKDIKNKNNLFTIEVNKTNGNFNFDLNNNKIREKFCIKYKIDFKDLDFLIRCFISFFLFDKGIFLLHGSALANKDFAYVFIGPSGSGKTTILKIGKKRGFVPMADDTSIIYKNSNNFYIIPSVFDKTCGSNFIHKKFKLKKIFFIKKNIKNYLEEINLFKKVILILKNTLFDNFDQGLKRKNENLYHHLLANQPFYKAFLIREIIFLVKKTDLFILNFKKDESFLDILDK
jgi:hypothetical protein